MPRKTYAEFTPEEKKKADERTKSYQKRTFTRFCILYHNQNDRDIIEQLNTVQNRTDYIRRLIRADIAKENETEE